MLLERCLPSGHRLRFANGPTQAAGASARAPNSSQQAVELRILVVDGNADTALTPVLPLRLGGHQVSAGNDARSITMGTFEVYWVDALRVGPLGLVPARACERRTPHSLKSPAAAQRFCRRDAAGARRAHNGRGELVVLSTCAAKLWDRFPLAVFAAQGSSRRCPCRSKAAAGAVTRLVSVS
jgi:hypothetical protein